AVEAPVQRRFDLAFFAAADATADQARRDHPCVVDDQRVAGLQQIGEIAYSVILQFRRAASGVGAAGPHYHQPRRVTRHDRTQRNPGRRKIEIKEIGTHGLSSRQRAAERRAPDDIVQDQGAPVAIDAFRILSGSRTGSPRLILSTFSMPSTTCPHTVYWRVGKEGTGKQKEKRVYAEKGRAPGAHGGGARPSRSAFESGRICFPLPPRAVGL